MKTSLVRLDEHRPDFFLAIMFFGALSLISPTGGTIANAQSGAVKPQATIPNTVKPSTAGQSTVKGRVVYKDNAQEVLWFLGWANGRQKPTQMAAGRLAT